MCGSLEGEGEKDAAHGADGASGGAPQPRMAPFVRPQWKVLAVVCVTGVAYNVGMVAGPWLEGLLAQQLANILAGRAVAASMVPLACAYVAAIAAVQLMRYLKRLYVRKFANNVNRAMKRTLYHNLLLADERTLEREGVGSLMTKALSDVDDCVEGVRKFTTEIFDTGVVMVAYMAMLLAYDWRTTLLALVFPPLSYVLAARMKRPVTRATAAAKQSVSGMATAALDRVEGATSYRALGLEGVRDRLFERDLADYERKETRANVLSTALMPVYQAISLLGAGTVIVCGARDVLGVGWAAWNIAAFTTFFSVFTKLAVKSSHAGKLFNAVQRAQVSWRRIRPYMGQAAADDFAPAAEAPRWPAPGRARPLLCLPRRGPALPARDVCGRARAGRGRHGRGEAAASPRWAGCSVASFRPPQRAASAWARGRGHAAAARCLGFASRLGHDPQLLDASVEDNVLLGDDADPRPDLRRACLLDDVERMPRGLRTPVGEGGAALSGGQRARARPRAVRTTSRAARGAGRPVCQRRPGQRSAAPGRACASSRASGAWPWWSCPTACCTSRSSTASCACTTAPRASARTSG